MTDDAPDSVGPSPLIFAAVSRVLADLPAIGKSDFNKDQNFHFRGVDAVLNALNPLLADHGVTVVPHKVIERVAERRTTRSGGAMYEVNLHVQFRLYARDGSYIEAEAWGEGTDMADKATSKAHTAAQKSMLIQTFSISTKEQTEEEPDRQATEETVLGPPVAPRAIINGLRARIAKLPDEAKAKLRDEWKSTFSGPVSQLLVTEVDDASDLVALYEREYAAKAEPPAPAGPANVAAAGAPSTDPGRPFE